MLVAPNFWSQLHMAPTCHVLTEDRISSGILPLAWLEGIPCCFLILETLAKSSAQLSAGLQGWQKGKEGTGLLIWSSHFVLLSPWGWNSESLCSPGSITPGHVPTARNHYLKNRQNLIKGCCATSLLGYWNDSIAQNCTTPFMNCLVFLFFYSVTGWHTGASIAALPCPCSTELSHDT